MDKGAYELIKLLIQNVAQQLEFSLVNGKHIVIDIQPENLIAELEKVVNIEKEADWLADELIGHGHILGTPADSAEELIRQWRNAARKAVSEAK